MRLNVALISDSFPPMVDGVSRCVLGYARALSEGGYGNCVVVTPHVPGEKYSSYPFPVITFPSLGLPQMPYRAGYPFVPLLSRQLKKMDINILHAHSPFMSMAIARQLRRNLKIPIVFTQHTKWEYDIGHAVSMRPVAKLIETVVYENIRAADEVWAVSRGTAHHMVKRGYQGGYIVMENGTDFPQAEAKPELLALINRKYGLNDDQPVLIFVGRMMWYKNIRLILESLELLRRRGQGFHMMMVGDGSDLGEIKRFARDKGLSECVHFTGRVSDREKLRALYTRADLMVFPSTYDNAPLVIREAAACRCPAVVTHGSSTAEILEDGGTGFFAHESPGGVANAIQIALSDRRGLERVAEAAAERVYLPWPRIIERASERYEVVIKNYREKRHRYSG